MATFQSKIVNVNKNNSELYNFLSDFRNFGTVMPPQIQDWKATEDTCSFIIPNMTSLSLRFKEKDPGSKLVLVPDNAPFAFELVCTFAAISETTSKVQILFNAELNPMLSMMASKPLQNFVDLLAQQIETKFN